MSLIPPCCIVIQFKCLNVLQCSTTHGDFFCCFRCQVELHIQPVGNGLWRFPISFEATDPLPDDNIVLIARKLTGETKTSFRLTSLTR